ncbi:hypothetical protein B0T14DRAFT_134990 [Immersiella caudata]|uniref:Uncharacterized protein n=1 Tax=Immersiella caudata TaxID=314043 RepID=A0AA39X559_9PEZI|nr:hypothetical protein B0T14DRAFT_134990 [Immersiella caudata]
MDGDVWEALTDVKYARSIAGASAIVRVLHARQNVHGYAATPPPAPSHASNLFPLSLSMTCGKSYQEMPSASYAQYDGDLSKDGQSRHSIWRIAIITVSLKAMEPRDKIYGLLGLAESSIIPDYSKPMREVFIELAENGLQSDFDPIMR